MSKEIKVKSKNKRLDLYPKRSEDISWVKLKDEIVVLNLRNGYSYVLNAVGGFAWLLIDGSRSLEEVLRKIVNRYQIDEDKARAHLNELMSDLLKRKLVIIHNAKINKLQKR